SLAVLEDNYGNLWISNNNGLTKFNSSDSSMIYFSEKDGLQSKEFNSSSAFKNKKGEMFFGGVNGFNMFHPDSIRFNENIPQIAITDIKILNKSIPITKTNEQNKLTISYFENFISFEFAVLDFTNPEKNEYKHMMEGFDEDWIYSGNKHTTDYTNLDPGDYIFKVIGCNSDGVWNLEGSSIALSILPPIWMTWWFRISLVVFILSILWYIHKIRLKRLIELEKLRTKIASDLHDEVGASLTSLSIQSQMLSYEKDDSKLDKRIETINNISKNTINTMRDVVWSIDSRNDTLQNLIEKMKETAFQILNERDIDIKYSIEIETPEKKLNIAIRQNIYLIFKEAINNTVKHSNATNIKVIVIVKNNSFDMSIKDNGSGISKLEENHHYGGLSNMKLRARKIGGELKIINRNGVLIKLIIRKI
ncbi:MAG TPA: triple tyrosine motif-containing protein, partial [Bacteroidales bacterium]|nr:triple tyrosine motif-containing protein [Bacteroidales bacterium]